MSQELVLYDLPSKGECKCWSPNTWKTRAALNYKKIPYKTEWITYPELGPKFKSLGIPPNPEGSFAPYTVPVVRFPDGSHIMGSLEIAERLEMVYPEPSLRLNSELQQQLSKCYGQAIGPLMPFFMARVHRDIITDAEMDWFRNDRESRCGMSLEEWEESKGGEDAWRAGAPGFEQLTKFLKEHKQDDGPFILGSQPCYVDLAASSQVEFFSRCGQDAYERLVRNVPGLKELRDACEPWYARNKY